MGNARMMKGNLNFISGTATAAELRLSLVPFEQQMPLLAEEEDLLVGDFVYNKIGGDYKVLKAWDERFDEPNYEPSMLILNEVGIHKRFAKHIFKRVKFEKGNILNIYGSKWWLQDTPQDRNCELTLKLLESRL